MTVIAFDGVTLAADKLATFEDGTAMGCTKIWRRFDGVIYGMAGQHSKCMKVREWFERVGPPEEFPVETGVELLFVETDGTINLITSGPHPMTFEGTQFAVGNAAPMAQALMHVGFGAELAVQKVCEVNIYCGKGVDILRIS